MAKTSEHKLHWDTLSTESVGEAEGGDGSGAPGGGEGGPPRGGHGGTPRDGGDESTADAPPGSGAGGPPGDGGDGSTGDDPPGDEQGGPPGGAETPPGESFPPATFANFRIVTSLGRGAMGHVYLAQDVSIGRLVAIKFIREPGERQRKRFLREANALGMLDHPNIVKIYQLGEIEGQPYIVAEYVAGESLSARGKPMPWQEALALGIGMADGLAAAHRRNVLHRDIKPSNVMIAQSGKPKLLDFGLAKLEDAVEDGTEMPAIMHGALRDPRATETGTILGTPYYMAPEAWRGEASFAADVYSLGVVLYELCTGRVPFHDVPRDELRRALQERDAPRLSQVAPQVLPAFAAVIERCLGRDPDQRFANGEQLLAALLALETPVSRTSDRWSACTPEPAQEHPYPGLRPFDAEDSRHFFGRDDDIRRLLARLRNTGLVLVAGTSGVGKSSLVRAGILPYLGTHGLDETIGRGPRGWEVRAWVPGMQPLQAMSAALRADVDMDEDALAEALAHDPADVGRRLQRRARTGMVLFVDQLEELVTVADAAEAALTSRALATLAARFPRLRVLATVRGDKLVEIGALPGFDTLIAPALYILQPLGELQVREAVVRPAERCGVRFESDAMVDTLVRDTIRQAGGLPLLQSALALLWERRDQARALIPESALSDIGGVAGALARHADRVLDELLPEDRMAARAILLRLITLGGSRARYTEDEILAGSAVRKPALAALVAGRLLVAREIDGKPVYEIAHEALVDGWPTLRAWLTEEDRLMEVKQQIAHAAEEWEHQDRAREALWQGRRLRQVQDVALDTLTLREQAFLLESRRMVRRTQSMRLLALGVALCSVAGMVGWSEYTTRREIRRHLDEAAALKAQASDLDTGYRDLRREALAMFAGFDATRPGTDEARRQDAESRWKRAVNLAPEIDRKWIDASRPLEQALLLDPGHTEVRRELGAVLHARALLAEDQGHAGELSVLSERLAGYEQALAARWRRPGRVTVELVPAGLQMELHEYEPTVEGALTMRSRAAGKQSPATFDLPPGSYLIVVPAQGDRGEIRYPFRLTPGSNLEDTSLRITVPLAREVPEDMVYVPAGRFWFGFGGDAIREPIREWQLSPPPHERSTDGFFIARRETTYAQWLEFLRALPPEERKARRPQAKFDDIAVELQIDGAPVFVYQIGSDQKAYVAREGERVAYPQRTQRQEQDWLQFPVTGIDGEDAQAYARWLSDRGIVPGARMCREDEWERAARGADLRVHPHGDALTPEDDANIDVTYGRQNGAYGFDEVGSHPQSRSPFGLDDMMGNAREMTVSIMEVDKLAQRSGSFFHALTTNLIVNREVQLVIQRNPHVGFRICADPPPPLRHLP
jgi:serine/threonine protein kinase/formylglycine-generating enzyme required for sulfatase activity